MCYPYSSDCVFPLFGTCPGWHTSSGLLDRQWAGGVCYLGTNIHVFKLHVVIDDVLVRNVYLSYVCVFGSHVLTNKNIHSPQNSRACVTGKTPMPISLAPIPVVKQGIQTQAWLSIPYTQDHCFPVPTLLYQPSTPLNLMSSSPSWYICSPMCPFPTCTNPTPLF